jgi:hypothetical protein
VNYLKPDIFEELYNRDSIETFHGLDNEGSRSSEEENSRPNPLTEYFESQSTNLTQSQSEYVRGVLDETAEVIDEELDVIIPRWNLFSENSSSKGDELIRVDDGYSAITELVKMDSSMVRTDYASDVLERARNSLE